ncbi:sugar ABC transporter substrate-binding protein [Streptomyces sp. A7024]|uniref:Sugar ABC transporter substrate-binding protein n=1 Tax=Streptomyces coryli TaxID=1128680 RepID=A0A6G4TWZ7_9ACTN|nr:sugar ABC transporter substrate-binding protein [Streptomyces coryli]NGN63638.1 sugar ABC transporter substrate-binding protein [Streptomyces coryli]
MWHRKVIAVGALAVAGTLLAGCGGSGGAGGKSTVTMWTYPVIIDEKQHRAFWDAAEKEFEKENPKVDVKVEILPWANRDEKLTTAMAGGKGPDVGYLIPDQLPKYAPNIEPYDEHISPEAKQAYRPAALKAATVDDQLMGAPLLMSSNPLICNKKVFDAVGEKDFPATWDDLLKLAPKFKAKGFDIITYNGDATATLNMTYYPLLWQAGGDVFSKDGKSVAFNSPQGVKALKFLRTLADDGYTEKSALTKANLNIEQTRIGRNKVGCTWQHVPIEVEKFWGKENIHVVGPLKDDQQVAYGTVGSLSMFKKAGDKDAAAKWINFVTAKKTMDDYDKKSGFFSPLDGNELYAGDPVNGQMEKSLNKVNVGPLYEKARDVMGVLSPEIQAALTGKKSPAKALEDAEKAAKGITG